MVSFDEVMDMTMKATQPIVDIADSIKVPDIVNFPPLMKAGEALGNVFGSSSFPYRVENVNLSDPVFWQAALMILIQPTTWNVIGRIEYHTHLFTKCIKPIVGVYMAATWIFVLSLFRNAMFVAAIERQETVDWMGTTPFKIVGSVCLVFGVILVLSSFYRLGVTGTYLGDYFGILMEEKVVKFPFNILSDPMYDGSTLIFLGKAITAQSVAGILLSGWVYIVYRVWSVFEGSFTEYIYSQKAKQKSA